MKRALLLLVAIIVVAIAVVGYTTKKAASLIAGLIDRLDAELSKRV